eukprot:359718-Chlamydomonas_euryale.AAC.7
MGRSGCSSGRQAQAVWKPGLWTVKTVNAVHCAPFTVQSVHLSLSVAGWTVCRALHCHLKQPRIEPHKCVSYPPLVSHPSLPVPGLRERRVVKVKSLVPQECVPRCGKCHKCGMCLQVWHVSTGVASSLASAGSRDYRATPGRMQLWEVLLKSESESQGADPIGYACVKRSKQS